MTSTNSLSFVHRRQAIGILAATALLNLGWAEAAQKLAPMRPEVPIHALVIGVSYAMAPEIFHLRNTVRDARLIADLLMNRLSQPVMLVEDPRLSALTAKVEEYLAGLQSSEIALIYYAGHGVQIDGQNYVLAAEADALVSLAEVVERARLKARMVVLILDACRNNPFSNEGAVGETRSLRIASLAPAGGGLGDTRGLTSVPVSAAQLGMASGLAQFRLQGRGVKVVFSTDPGNVALDGDGDASNSPFTSSLVRSLTERKSLDEVLADVTKQVARQTGGRQTPWVQGSLEEAVFVAGRPKQFDRRDINMPLP